MMGIDAEKLYSDFIIDQGFQGRKKSIKREKFLRIAKELNDPTLISSFSSKEAARNALRDRASGSLGLIGFFIFKTVIYWIIDKILEHYFK